MVLKKSIKYPSRSATYDPKTDTPLCYFSVKDVFVRCTRANSYKLYSDGYMLLLYAHDGYLYFFPKCDKTKEEYVEAFISTYAPHFNYELKRSTLKINNPIYIGLPETITV